jgi:hypothetical protein
MQSSGRLAQNEVGVQLIEREGTCVSLSNQQISPIQGRSGDRLTFASCSTRKDNNHDTGQRFGRSTVGSEILHATTLNSGDGFFRWFG